MRLLVPSGICEAGCFVSVFASADATGNEDSAMIASPTHSPLPVGNLFMMAFLLIKKPDRAIPNRALRNGVAATPPILLQSHGPDNDADAPALPCRIFLA